MMDTPITLTGGCVCGAVRYRTLGLPARITVCHCTWCQRRTGSAFGSECVFRLDDVTFIGDALRSYRHLSDESGRWLEQDFCGTCGANVGLRLEALPDIRSLALGSFDDRRWLDKQGVLVRHVFIRSAQSVSDIPAGVERYEQHFRA